MKKTFTLFVFLIGVVVWGYGQPVSQTFSTAGTFTYTVPAGYSASVTVEAWGGGGGGNNGTGAEGGGGGGAYASKTFTVTSGDYTVVVGAGGTPGNPGGNSSFESEVIAVGGSSSNSNNMGSAGGAAAISTGDVKWSGGNGGNAANNAGGGGGGSGYSAGNGGNGGNGISFFQGGVGGTSGTGGGSGGTGGSWFLVTFPGNPGNSPGGGGGGKGAAGGASGSGAPGQVIVTVNSALPVTWLSFRAALDGDDVQLAWSTASESNNEGFDVQRSENGREWQTIAFVPGAGTTSEVTNYEYTDPSPFTLHPSLYYRLQQRDYDGTTDYSPVRVIQLEVENAIRVFPNPADEAVTVAFAEPIEKRGTIQLFNQNGRLVAEEVVAPGTSEHTLRVSYLPAGNYMLRVVVGAQVWTKRVVVE